MVMVFRSTLSGSESLRWFGLPSSEAGYDAKRRGTHPLSDGDRPLIEWRVLETPHLRHT